MLISINMKDFTATRVEGDGRIMIACITQERSEENLTLNLEDGVCLFNPKENCEQPPIIDTPVVVHNLETTKGISCVDRCKELEREYEWVCAINKALGESQEKAIRQRKALLEAAEPIVVYTKVAAREKYIADKLKMLYVSECAESYIVTFGDLRHLTQIVREIKETL